MRKAIAGWLRRDAGPAIKAGLIVGFIVGLRDAFAVMRGAYDPWLVSRRLIAVYPVVEAVWWGAILLGVAVLLSLVRGIGNLLFGVETRKLRASPWLLYGLFGLAAGVVALAFRSPSELFSLLPIPGGRRGALAFGAGAGGLATMVLLAISRVRLVTEDRPGAEQRGSKLWRVTAALGVAVIFVLAAMTVPRGGRPTASSDVARPPNVLLITVDALRGDAVGCLSETAPPTPEIDKLAARGVAFTEAFAQAPWTLPSFASMMTSHYPSEVGIALVEGLPFEQQKGNAYPLDDSAPVLAELLRAAGYRTAAQLTVPYTEETYGLHRGFMDHRHCQDRSRQPLLYDALAGRLPGLRPRYTSNDAEALTKGAVAWLADQRGDPFFLWVHYVDPHAPYGNPEAIASFGDQCEALVEAARQKGGDPDARAAARLELRRLYDEEVTYVDRWIGELLTSLSQLGQADRTLVILTADHGEGFWEHGSLGHGHRFDYEVLHVPLIIAFPDGRGAGRQVGAPVRLLDIMPTVLQAANVEAPSDLRGASLFPLLEGTEDERLFPRELLAECRYASPEAKCIRAGPWFVIYSPDEDVFEVVAEEQLAPLDSASSFPDVPALKARLGAWTEEMNRALSGPERSAPVLTPEQRQQLEALGYL